MCVVKIHYCGNYFAIMIRRVMNALKNSNFLVSNRRFVKIFQRKFLVNCFIIYFLSLILLLIYKYYLNGKFSFNSASDSDILEIDSLVHNLTVARYFEFRKHWKTSNLGSLLFKNENNSFHQKDKTFVVLVWKYWNWLKDRHVNNYGPKGRNTQDILKECSVNNCVFTGNNKRIDTADAVIVHIMHGVYPKVKERNPNQIWAFLSDESPKHAFNMAKSNTNVELWGDVFNWSMTYRTNADVPVPYGRTVALPKPILPRVTYETLPELIPNLQFKRTDVLVAVLMSNCGIPYRAKLISELKKYINIDVYGRCGTDEKKNLCQGHFKRDCPLLDQYYFYLVMENTMCSEYITEKTFHNAYSKGAIPILVGTFLTDAENLLPPNSYMHYADFNSAKKLAAKVTSTIQNIREYLSYHLWRNHFEVRNEHGYFGTKSQHLCRMCEALNYNEEKQKIYGVYEFRRFVDPSALCLDVKING